LTDRFGGSKTVKILKEEPKKKGKDDNIKYHRGADGRCAARKKSKKTIGGVKQNELGPRKRKEVRHFFEKGGPFRLNHKGPKIKTTGKYACGRASNSSEAHYSY